MRGATTEAAFARVVEGEIALERLYALAPDTPALSDDRPINEYYFLRRWRRSLLAKAACFPHLYDFGDLRRFPTLTTTTEFFAVHYARFPDLDAYLNGYAITGEALASLAVPSRLVAAADDPVIPINDLAAVARAPALEVDVLERGGHCGFLEDYRLRSWLDRAVLADVERAC